MFLYTLILIRFTILKYSKFNTTLYALISIKEIKNLIKHNTAGFCAVISDRTAQYYFFNQKGNQLLWKEKLLRTKHQ